MRTLPAGAARWVRSRLVPLAWGGALLCTLGWTAAGGAYSLALDADWQTHSGAAVLEGQLARWVHTPTGGGLALRDLDAAALFDVKGRAERLDLEGALSPDRVARVAQHSQDEEDVGLTVAITPGDGPDTGRWVYLPPARAGEPPRVWWQVFWRSARGHHQAVGWAPLAQGAAFAQAMRAVERAVQVDPGFTPPQGVLFDAGRDDCGPPVRASRAQALATSRRPAEAQAALRARYQARLMASGGPMDPATGLALGELRAVGLLYRMVEDCVLRTAREHRECRVEEGRPEGTRSTRFQQAVVACLDADTTLSAALDGALTPFLGAP